MPFRKTAKQLATEMDVTSARIYAVLNRPNAKAFLARLTKDADLQLQALYAKSVDAIGESLLNGNCTEKLAAARLQLEATRRLGPAPQAVAETINMEARLQLLANRLLALRAKVYAEADGEPIPSDALRPTEAS